MSGWQTNFAYLVPPPIIEHPINSSSFTYTFTSETLDPTQVYLLVHLLCEKRILSSLSCHGRPIYYRREVPVQRVHIDQLKTPSLHGGTSIH